jgi:hypothetical protein
MLNPSTLRRTLLGGRTQAVPAAGALRVAR